MREAGASKTSGFSFLNSAHTVQPPKIIEPGNVYTLNGYTKNISGLIFSPGLNTRPKTASQNDMRKSLAVPKTPALNEAVSPSKSKAEIKSTLSGTKSRYSKTE